MILSPLSIIDVAVFVVLLAWQLLVQVGLYTTITSAIHAVISICMYKRYAHVLALTDKQASSPTLYSDRARALPYAKEPPAAIRSAVDAGRVCRYTVCTQGF
jgi:Flp pilus assembly protein protease CpaA